MDSINLIRVLKIPPFLNGWVHQLSITPSTHELLGDALYAYHNHVFPCIYLLNHLQQSFVGFSVLSFLWPWGYSLCFTFSMLLQLELS